MILIQKKEVRKMLSFLKKLFNKKNNGKKNNKDNKGNLSEWSYQRFCGFFGSVILKDQNFYDKINKIIDAVNNKKMERIDEIAYYSGCTTEETVMKIKYLKNKRVFDNIYIDHVNRAVKKCTKEDQEILDKYYNMLYNDHFSIKEMAARIPNYHNKPILIIEEDVYKEIKYLYDKCIINGIKLDDYNKEIIYYTIEKHKKAVNYATVNCPKCGALVDVSRGGNGRCDYCGSIVEDTTDGNFK